MLSREGMRFRTENDSEVAAGYLSWRMREGASLAEALDLAVGTIRATFLIETLPAAFQMEEILYELRGNAAGLNVGRWDKIFSDIKCLRAHSDRVLPDRATIGMNRPWMRAYAEELIRVCHAHGAHAMGGMAAFTPGSSTPCSALKTIEAESPPASGNSVARSSRPALLSEAGAVMLGPSASSAPVAAHRASESIHGPQHSHARLAAFSFFNLFQLFHDSLVISGQLLRLP